MKIQSFVSSITLLLLVLFSYDSFGGLVSSNGKTTWQQMVCFLTPEVRDAAPIPTMPAISLTRNLEDSFSLQFSDPAAMTSDPVVLIPDLRCSPASSGQEADTTNHCASPSTGINKQGDDFHFYSTTDETAQVIDFDIATPTVSWKFTLPTSACLLHATK